MFAVWCDADNCGACGPMRADKADAVRAWNEFSCVVATMMALLPPLQKAGEDDGQDDPEKSAAESQVERGGVLKPMGYPPETFQKICAVVEAAMKWHADDKGRLMPLTKAVRKLNKLK